MLSDRRPLSIFSELPLSSEIAIVTMVKPPLPPPTARDKRAASLAAEREKQRAALLASISSAPAPQAPATPSRNPHDTRSSLQRVSGETPRSARYLARSAEKLTYSTAPPVPVDDEGGVSSDASSSSSSSRSSLASSGGDQAMLKRQAVAVAGVAAAAVAGPPVNNVEVPLVNEVEASPPTVGDDDTPELSNAWKCGYCTYTHLGKPRGLCKMCGIEPGKHIPVMLDPWEIEQIKQGFTHFPPVREFRAAIGRPIDDVEASDEAVSFDCAAQHLCKEVDRVDVTTADEIVQCINCNILAHKNCSEKFYKELIDDCYESSFYLLSSLVYILNVKAYFFGHTSSFLLNII